MQRDNTSYQPGLPRAAWQSHWDSQWRIDAESHCDAVPFDWLTDHLRRGGVGPFESIGRQTAGSISTSY